MTDRVADDNTVDGVPLPDAIRDAIGRAIDAARTPEFMARLQERVVQDAPILMALNQGAGCWLDADGEHVWFAHACNGEWVETKLPYGRPLGFKGNGGGWCATQTDPLSVEPSITCDDCGFHTFYANGRFV